MRTLTINIADNKSQKALLDYLDSIGLKYVVELNEKTYSWWEDNKFVEEIENRSMELTSGKDNGFSLSEMKSQLRRK